MMLKRSITPASQSPFSPPILIHKKDEPEGFVLNPAINIKAFKDKFPIPVIQELSNQLHETQVFTRLNSCSCNHQIQPLNVERVYSYHSHFQFLRMDFGLTYVLFSFKSGRSWCLARSPINLCLFSFIIFLSIAAWT